MSGSDYFLDQNLIDLYDKVEPVKLSLTKYEAGLILYELEKLPVEQTKEPFINSINKKLKEQLELIK